MSFEMRVKKYLEENQLYDAETYRYVISRVRDTHQNDFELGSQIMGVIFSRTRSKFLEQVDDYQEKKEVDNFDDILKIFEKKDTRREPVKRETVKDDRVSIETRKKEEEDKRFNEEFEEIFNSFIADNDPPKVNEQTIDEMFNNFSSRSVYRDDEKREYKPMSKKKKMFIGHAVAFTVFSLLTAYIDPVAMEMGIRSSGSFMSLFTEAFISLNALYGGIEVVKFFNDPKSFLEDKNSSRGR